MVAWSAYTYFFVEDAISGFKALGFPDYFRVQLAILKIGAVIALHWPAVPLQVKEWAYAGVGLFLLTALVAHVVHKDGALITAILLVFMTLLVVSNMSLHKLNI